MKKILLFITAIFSLLVGVGCQSNETTNGVDEFVIKADGSIDVLAEARIEYNRLLETAAYARSDKVKEDELIEKLEGHHERFRDLEKEYAKQEPIREGLNSLHMFLTGMVDYTDELSSAIINYGLDKGIVDPNIQFSEELLSIPENLLKNAEENNKSPKKE
jgi:hypothetical protein